MSTYYYFHCVKCKVKGGFYSRQAWGWGSFDIIESFKFLAYHTDKCGEEQLRVISEHDDEYIDLLDLEYNNYIEDTKENFPSSNDWKFMMDNKEKSIEEIQELWVKSNLLKNPDIEQLKIIGIIEEVTIIEKKRGSYLYKAVLLSAQNIRYSIVEISKRLPSKGNNYVVIGKQNTHPIEGEIVFVDNIKELK